MDLNDIRQMDDLEVLLILKEKLKDRVVDQTISWEYRIHLYTQISTINERILHLRNLHQFTV